MVRGTNLAPTIQMSVTFCDFARDISSIFFSTNQQIAVRRGKCIGFTPQGGRGGSGVAPGNSSSGCAARLSHFPHLFSDQTSKLHTRFHTWPLGRGYVIIT